MLPGCLGCGDGDICRLDGLPDPAEAVPLAPTGLAPQREKCENLTVGNGGISCPLRCLILTPRVIGLNPRAQGVLSLPKPLPH